MFLFVVITMCFFLYLTILINKAPDSMGSDVCAVCASPANQRCGGCHVTYYCCRNHQKHHWKDHRAKCRPFKIQHSEELGRYLVATRDIRAGEVLLREEALVSGPAQVTAPVCLGCYSALSPHACVACPRCGWPMCSTRCASSPRHVPECRVTSDSRGAKMLQLLISIVELCKNLEQIAVKLEEKNKILEIENAELRERLGLNSRNSSLHNSLNTNEIVARQEVSIRNFEVAHPMYQCVTVLRCLFLRDADPAMWEKISALESHCQHRKGTPKYEADRVAVAQFVRRFFKMEHVDEEEILRVCGIVQVNGHEVPVTEPAHVAIYEVASMLEHSCRANCSKSFTAEGGLLLRAALPISRGQHLSICYTDALWGTANRRHHLLETKFFWCRCSRCADPTELGTYFSALRCQQPGCSGLALPMDPLADNPDEAWQCGSCLTALPASEMFSLLERVGAELAALPRGEATPCVEFLSRHEAGGLAHDHFYLADVRLALAQLLGQDKGLAALSDSDLCEKERLCRQILSLVERLCPAENRVRGLLLCELQATLSEVTRRRANLGQMDAAAFRDTLVEKKKLLSDAVDLLCHEPDVLPEGKMCEQAKLHFQECDNLLSKLHASVGVGLL